MSNVVVVGIGARTPVGLTAVSSAAAVRGGLSRIREHPFMIDSAGDPLLAATDARLDPRLLGWQRLAPLAASALSEAFAQASPIGLHGATVPVLLSLAENRPGFTAHDASLAVSELGGALVGETWSSRPEPGGNGHAGVLLSITTAIERLRFGQDAVIVVGGVDSYLEAKTLDAWAASKRIIARGVRAGFHPGEGAAFLVLTLAEHARRLGLPALARIRGAGGASEARTRDTGLEVLGHGLSVAVDGATAPLRSRHEQVDDVFCDINGERYRTQEWGMTLLRTKQAFRSTTYVAPANLWGDMGAASGALGCVLAIRAWARGYANGPRALVWASSDLGLRGAALLQHPESV